MVDFFFLFEQHILAFMLRIKKQQKHIAFTFKVYNNFIYILIQ